MKPPKQFCKQKISDSLEERIILTNDYILPMKRSMCFFFTTQSEVSHEVMLKRKNRTKLVVIKTCRPYLFQMTCSADRQQLSPLTARCNASEFSYQATNPSCTGQYHIVIILYLPSQWCKDAENGLILSCRNLKCLNLVNWGKGSLFFHMNCGKLETTLAPILD